MSLTVVFLGTPAIAAPSLRAVVGAGHRVPLVITQPDRPAGRGKKLRRGELAAAADKLGLAVAQPARAAEALDDLARLAPDVLAVLAYGQILPASVLAAPRLGPINVHFSLLPLLRGAAPINRAILEGHADTGVTAMFMETDLDTGDIIRQEATSIGPQETAGQLADRLAELGSKVLVETLADLEAGTARRTPQEHAKATWAGLLTKAEGEVDWTRPAAELDHHVRGMDPWPAAYTRLEGQPLRLFAPTAILPGLAGARPGQVLEPRPEAPDMLTVATGDGALGLGQVQAAGKRRMAAGDWLRGARLAPGDLLGG